jgi:hypothetical protein
MGHVNTNRVLYFAAEDAYRARWTGQVVLVRPRDAAPVARWEVFSAKTGAVTSFVAWKDAAMAWTNMRILEPQTGGAVYAVLTTGERLAVEARGRVALGVPEMNLRAGTFLNDHEFWGKPSPSLQIGEVPGGRYSKRTGVFAAVREAKAETAKATAKAPAKTATAIKLIRRPKTEAPAVAAPAPKKATVKRYDTVIAKLGLEESVRVTVDATGSVALEGLPAMTAAQLRNTLTALMAAGVLKSAR